MKTYIVDAFEKWTKQHWQKLPLILEKWTKYQWQKVQKFVTFCQFVHFLRNGQSGWWQNVDSPVPLPPILLILQPSPGTYWVYDLWGTVNTTDSKDIDNYCSSSVYWISFAQITVVTAFLMVELLGLLICVLLIGCLTCCCRPGATSGCLTCCCRPGATSEATPLRSAQGLMILDNSDVKTAFWSRSWFINI